MSYGSLSDEEKHAIENLCQFIGRENRLAFACYLLCFKQPDRSLWRPIVDWLSSTWNVRLDLDQDIQETIDMLRTDQNPDATRAIELIHDVVQQALVQHAEQKQKKLEKELEINLNHWHWRPTPGAFDGL